MKPEQCVSLDCYRQSRYFNLISLPELLKEISAIEDVTGIDAVTESLPFEYPVLTESFCEHWKELLDKNGLRPVTLAQFIDRLQMRTHIMDAAETADALRRDLYIAKRLGFENLRMMHDLPLEAVEMALPLAEELDIRLLDELMPPGTIKPHSGRKGMDCTNVLNLIHRTGTRHLGFHVNTGLFQTQPNPTQLLDVLLRIYPEDSAADTYNEIMEQFQSVDFPSFEEWINKNHPYMNTNRELFQRMFGVRLFGHSVIPEDLSDIMPYVYDIYGKYIKMYPDPKNPDNWLEPSIPYDEIFRVLAEHNYDGPITSMRMNAPGLSLGANRSYDQILQEEVTEVRRSQNMFSALYSSSRR